MIHKLLMYINANPVEFRIVSLSTFASAVAPIDLLLKYIIPIASALTWYFLKPKLDKWTKNKKNNNN